MTDRKLILPTEVKVCATCTYWDGERAVDPEMRIVVVGESCRGECLVSETGMSALSPVDPSCDCLWEDIEADEAPAADAAPPAPGSGEPA